MFTYKLLSYAFMLFINNSNVTAYRNLKTFARHHLDSIYNSSQQYSECIL